CIQTSGFAFTLPLRRLNTPQCTIISIKRYSIASVGAILYLVMDMIVHLGVFKRLRGKGKANPANFMTAFMLEVIVLTAFVWVKLMNDWLIVAVSIVFIIVIFIGEYVFLKNRNSDEDEGHAH